MTENNNYQAPEVELRLLASFCYDPTQYYRLNDCISRSIFTQHKELFDSFVRALETEQLKDIPRLDDIERSQDTAADANHLSTLYQKRMAKMMLDKAMEKLTAETDSAEQVLKYLDETAKKISQSIRNQNPIYNSALLRQLPTIFDFVKSKQIAAKENGGLVGLSTTIPALDRLLGGLQTGLHLLSAQPGTGKTAFALQIARKTAEKGVPAIFLTYEQSPSILGLKAICSKYGLIAKGYMDGTGDISTLEKRIREAQVDGWTDKLYIIEGDAKTTVASLKNMCNSIIAKHQSKRCLVVVDYLQRWSRALPTHKEIRLDVSALSSDLRTLSTSLESPVLAISSQNRAGKDDASMSRLRESGDLEFDGDTISFLTCQKGTGNSLTEERQLSLSLVKNRFGNTGDINIRFRPASGDFFEIVSDRVFM